MHKLTKKQILGKTMTKIIQLCCLFFSGCAAMLISNLTWANLPYHPIQFPRDEAAHYENVPYPVNTFTEWWYYNGKLTSKTGRKLGYFLSFNYTKLSIDGKKLLIPMFNIQVSDIDNKKVYGSQTFYFNDKSTISSQTLDVSFGKDATLRKNNNTFLIDGSIQSKQGPNLNFAIQLTPMRKPLFVGERGIIDMGDETNSYYYTYTRLETRGHIQIGNELFEFDPKQSLSWMDHQWGDFFIIPDRYQWMWASVQLENGIDILLGNVIDPKTGEYTRGSANIIMPDDRRIYITDLKNDFVYIPEKLPGQKVPWNYDLKIKSIDLHLKLQSLVPGQDVTGIWEGISDAQGTYLGQPVKGQAYTEYFSEY